MTKMKGLILSKAPSLITGVERITQTKSGVVTLHCINGKKEVGLYSPSITEEEDIFHIINLIRAQGNCPRCKGRGFFSNVTPGGLLVEVGCVQCQSTGKEARNA